METPGVYVSEKWAALFVAAEQLAEARSPDAVADIVRETARAITGADGITFVAREGELCHYIAEDAVGPLWAGQKFDLTECVSGWVMLHGGPAVIADIYADERVPHDAYRATFVKSMAMMPVKARSRDAAIGAYWSEMGEPAPEALALLGILARFVGAALTTIDDIEESERRFRILVDGVVDYAIYMLDPQGRITNWNAGAERIKGYTAAEIMGRHFSEFYTADDRKAGLPDRALEIAKREGRFEAEGWRVRKDGSEFWASVVVDAVRDETGKLIGFAKVTRDLTDKRLVEEQLRQSQKMEAVGQLTGGIAHDFNNLLTIITGNIDMAGRLLAADDANARARRAIESAMRGAERAAMLTQRLLAFSRRQPLSPKPLDLDKVVSGVSDLLKRSLGELVHLEIVTSPGLWRVEADPNQIEAALVNLAVNARDAMPDGGTLTIETANAHLDTAYAATHSEVPPGNYVVVAVSDTGIGMPKETLARVFEPFFTTKEIGRGTGLGLSQVYGFVKQSGGHVTVYSEESHGTTLKLYLPRFTGLVPEEDVATANGGSAGSASGETILVVEDDDEVRSYSVEVLRDLGYSVLEAADGAAALRLLERPEISVDLLFTDVVMPGLSGRDLSDAARKLRPMLKVLYTSGYTKNAIVHGGRLDPGVALLQKPFTFQDLAERVRDLLDAGAGRRLLIVEADPTVRLLAAEALCAGGFSCEHAATASEAMGKLRAARGGYDAIVIDAALPDKGSYAFLAEIRAQYSDIPVVITDNDRSREPLDDSRAVRLVRPYTAQMVADALRSLGLKTGRA